jgi:mannose/fructose/N-acetylgalactosamine-specific phosphotransferase system component IID
MDAIGTTLVFMFERHAPGTQITNVGDALFWTTAQLLTISSQMSAPLTTGGRIVDIVLMFYAMTVVTARRRWSFGARSSFTRATTPTLQIP